MPTSGPSDSCHRGPVMMKVMTRPLDLFATPTSARTGPLGHAEPTVHWYTESTRPEADASRALVNHWYRLLPDPDGRVADRLRSEQDVDHLQAIDELLAHHLLRIRSVDVRYEEGGSGPDFRVYRDSSLVGAVEVLSLFDPQDWSIGQQRVNKLIDFLNERLGAPTHWFIGMNGDLEDFPEAEVPIRLCVDFLQSQLATLPTEPDFMDVDEWPTATFEFGKDSLEFCFLRRSADRPDEERSHSRIMAHGPTVGGMVNVGGRLKSRIGKKRPERYELEPDTPYLVFSVIHDSFGDEWDVKNALYGQTAVEIATKRSVRNGDGVFGTSRRSQAIVPKNTRIAGVSVCTGLQTSFIERLTLDIYDNPYAKRHWPSLLPHLRRFEKHGNGTLDWSPGDVTDLRLLLPSS